MLQVSRDRPGLSLPLYAALSLMPGVAGACLLAIGNAYPSLVDGMFATRWYPALANRLSFLWRIPIPVAPLIAALVSFWAVFGLAVSVLRSMAACSTRPAVEAALRRIAAAGLAYLMMIGMWGLQYARTPLVESERYTTSKGIEAYLPDGGTESPLSSMCARWISQANALARVARLHEPERVLERTPDMFDRARMSLAYLPYMPVPAPKPSGIDGILSRMMIEGIYIPFTFEPLVNMSIPAVDLPFVACHEVAHAMGFAREEEANLVAYEVCLRSPDPAFRYSGVMSALRYALNRVSRDNPRKYWELIDGMSEAVRRDYMERGRYWNALRDAPAAKLANALNSLFLSHAVKQASGVHSYERVVDELTIIQP